MIFKELSFCHFAPLNASILGEDSQIYLIFHLNILVFQTNRKQPYSFSVLSRLCIGLWDSPCLYNERLKRSRKCLLAKCQWLAYRLKRVNPRKQAWGELGGNMDWGSRLVLIITSYYMATSVSGQDEPNRALFLATQAGKMELSCPLWATRRVSREKFPRKPNNKFFINQALSVKMAG